MYVVHVCITKKLTQRSKKSKMDEQILQISLLCCHNNNSNSSSNSNNYTSDSDSDGDSDSDNNNNNFFYLIQNKLESYIL